MRLFLAIGIPEGLRRSLFELGRGLRRFGQVKTVEEQNIHLTLKFLGDADPGKVIEALDGIEFGPFDVGLKGLGAFPSLNYIRVVWAGCERGAQEVVALQNRIEGSLEGFERDSRFHPHATIARVRFPKDKKGLRKFMEQHASDDFGGFTVSSFELMKSELGRGGPSYETLRSFSSG